MELRDYFLAPLPEAVIGRDPEEPKQNSSLGSLGSAGTEQIQTLKREEKLETLSDTSFSWECVWIWHPMNLQKSRSSAIPRGLFPGDLETPCPGKRLCNYPEGPDGKIELKDYPDSGRLGMRCQRRFPENLSSGERWDHSKLPRNNPSSGPASQNSTAAEQLHGGKIWDET